MRGKQNTITRGKQNENCKILSGKQAFQQYSDKQYANFGCADFNRLCVAQGANRLFYKGQTMKTKTEKKRGTIMGRYWSLGNKKLPASTAIFNMTSATDCPSKIMGLCKVADICYAILPEKMYPKTCLPYRDRQAKYWSDNTASDFVLDFMSAVNRKRPINRPDTLRFSEAGDYRTQADVDKMELIATLLSGEGIACYTYTARSDLDYSNVRYLTINFSGFSAKTSGKSGTYSAIENIDDRSDNFGVCPCDCTKCRRCVIGLNSVVPMH